VGYTMSISGHLRALTDFLRTTSHHHGSVQSKVTSADPIHIACPVVMLQNRPDLEACICRDHAAWCDRPSEASVT
jgi:hypothetical protein